MPKPLPRMSQRGVLAPGRCVTPAARVRPAAHSALIGKGIRVAVLAGVCFSLAACAGSSTPLPDLRRASAPSLSQQEQKEAMEALSRKGSSHADNAVREIEGSK